MREYDVLTRGFAPEGTVGAQSKEDGCTTSRTTMYDHRLGHYLHRVKEGGFVIDKWGAGKGQAARLAVATPMLNLSLGPLEIDRMGDIDEVMLQGLSGDFKRLAELKQKVRGFSGMDYVGIEVYLSLWRSLEARIGTRRGDYIEWEDGEASEVAPVHPHPVDSCLRD